MQQTQSRQNLSTLEKKARASTPYKAAAIMNQPPAKLIAILGDRSASEFAKAKACQQLAVTGDANAVGALAPLLPDPKLSHYARFALEPIPDPAVDQALRDALGKTRETLLIGVVNSIGRREDRQALDALARLRHDQNQEVAEAASAALARIRRP